MADQYEWSTVSEEDVNETRVSFDMLGDEFIGTYLGSRQQANEGNGYTQYRFRGTDEEVYYISANWSLSSGMKSVRPNMLVRITYVADKDTGQASPMRIYRVEVANRKRQTPAQRPEPTPETPVKWG